MRNNCLNDKTPTMKTILLVAALGLSGLAGAQRTERWTVLLNSDVLLTAKTEDTAANVIKAPALKKGSLIVTYVPAQAQGERKRRLMVVDAADHELYSREAFNIAVPVSEVKKWKLATPLLRIYTVPVLGEAGANVRLRRVHLCTIRFD